MPELFADYVGKPGAALLDFLSSKSWVLDRSIEEDLPELLVNSVCARHDFEMSCDADETIRTIFLRKNPGVQALVKIPFSSGRQSVLERFGTPRKSGPPRDLPVLGAYGAWDLFTRPGHTIHVQYESGADRIWMITLIRPDVVP